LYTISLRVSSDAAGLPFEHAQHSVGHQKAADNINRTERNCDDENYLGQYAMHTQAEHDEPTQQHDPVNGIGAGHQRRMECVGHLRDDRETNKSGEHENREILQ